MSISDRLAEIRKRCDAATEGPWTYDPDEQRLASAKDNHHEVGSFGGYETDNLLSAKPFGSSVANESDALFIAHSRTDVPLLLRIAEAAAATYKLHDEMLHPMDRRCDCLICRELDYLEHGQGDA